MVICLYQHNEDKSEEEELASDKMRCRMNTLRLVVDSKWRQDKEWK